MNFFEAEILKGKYFPSKSRERLRATMVSLFIFIGIFALLFHAYEYFSQEYHIMLVVDVSIALVLLVSYLIFPRYISIDILSHIVLGVFAFLLFISFVVSDKDAAFSLFWLASLPVFVFFFLGVDKGIQWSINMFLILLFIPFFSFITEVKFAYEWELLSQVLFGYLVISYIIYIIENERSSYERRLARALEENQMLFKEVHHRTKNNMQVIMGLLETQSFKIDNPKYKKMFESHVDRLKAMSLMHKNLYVNHSYEVVNMQEYLNEIANSLRAYTHHDIVTDIDSVTVDMKTAMNIGLIFNEAVTNAMEHAFEEDEKGKIRIVLRYQIKGCVFSIQDNGKGFDHSKEYQSLGITLIEDLAKTLQDGSLVIKNIEGTLVKIYFSPKEYI